jgi:tetratricopeptide (TPR) repeat protein
MVLEAADSWAEAADMYSKALTVFDEIQSGYGRGLVLINQGRMYRQVNNFDDAIAQLTDARRTFARLGNRNYLAQALNELGCAHRNRRLPGDAELALQCFDESIAQAEKYGGRWMVAQNLVDRALLFQRQGDRDAARQSLARAGNVFDLQSDLPLYSLSLWTAAKLTFQEGEALEAERQATAAREQYLAAFTLFLESAATCVRNIRRGYQGRQAEWRYHRVLDEVQEKLHSRPPAEIPDYAERLKKEWQAKDLGEQFNDLITLCNDSLEAIGYF